MYTEEDIQLAMAEAEERGKRQRNLQGNKVTPSMWSSVPGALGVVGEAARSFYTMSPFSTTNAAIMSAMMSGADALYRGATEKQTSSATSPSTTKSQFVYGKGAKPSGRAIRKFNMLVDKGEDVYEASVKAFGTDYGTDAIQITSEGVMQDGEISGGVNAFTHTGHYSGVATSGIYQTFGSLYNIAATKGRDGREGEQIDIQSVDLSIRLQQTSWNFNIGTNAATPGASLLCALEGSFEACYRIVVYLSDNVYGTTTNLVVPTSAFSEVDSTVQVADKQSGKVRILHIEDVVMRSDPNAALGLYAQDSDYHKIDLCVNYGEDDIAVWDIGEYGADYTKCTRPELVVAVFQVGHPQYPQFNTAGYFSGSHMFYMSSSGLTSVTTGTTYTQADIKIESAARINYKK